MHWTVLALRRLRDDLAPTIGLLILIVVTAFLAALAPRVMASLADDAVRATVAAAPVADRNVQVIRHQLVGDGPAGDPLEQVRAAGQATLATFPAPVRRLIERTDAVIDSGRFRLAKPTTDPAFLRFRIQEGIGDHIRYVEGRPPTATVGTRDDVGPEAVDDVPVYEAAISRATADRFGIALDEVVTLIGDPGDPLIGRTPQDLYAFARISGIYEVPDPDSDYWLDDPLPIRPVIRALSSEVQLLDGVAILDEQTHAALAANTRAAGLPLRYTWRYFTDTGRITDRSTPGLVTALRALEVAYPSANVTPGRDTALRTNVLALLEGHQARWAAATSILAVMAMGPALVAIATLGLIAVLAGRRRRATMSLARSRGASAGQVLGPTLAEGLLLAVPAAGLAAMVSGLIVPAGRTAAVLAAALAVTVVAVAVVVITVIPTARAVGPDRRPGDRFVGRSSPRRVVFEALVIGLAVGGAWLLRERGIRAASSAGEVAGFDPLLAAVPVLVGIAAGLIALRVFPFVMRMVSAVARRRRGLVAMLAARRATEGGATTAVLLVLLATATVGAFGAASLDSLDRGADLAAWQEVGGAYRLDVPNGALPNGLDPSTLPDVEVAATEFLDRRSAGAQRTPDAVRRRGGRGPQGRARRNAGGAGVSRGLHRARLGTDPGDRVAEPGRQPARGEAWRDVHDERPGLHPHVRRGGRSRCLSRRAPGTDLRGCTARVVHRPGARRPDRPGRGRAPGPGVGGVGHPGGGCGRVARHLGGEPGRGRRRPTHGTRDRCRPLRDPGRRARDRRIRGARGGGGARARRAGARPGGCTPAHARAHQPPVEHAADRRDRPHDPRCVRGRGAPWHAPVRCPAVSAGAWGARGRNG